ncbi:YueI family protein [Ligilactobacillus salivarius]|uniref:YueI family protein n=1 Tax=Ligilactobacillus salivarius TaxID=1624 RepID=UPI0020234667|nr:YueI family protein [Ligilactobacillus salivarius]URI12285.1 YueI family protein [Ligilactobacillus salivarius]UUB34108.1 YueI family protein [Ligilactobacillus salivarius]
MTNDNLQEHLNNGLYGTPQLHPDEQRKYLGTFRERVSLTITFMEFSNNQNACLTAIKQEISSNTEEELNIKINGQLSSDIINKIIQISKENNTKFEYLADASFSHDDDANAIVICSPKSALHIENIDVESKYHDLFERKTEENNDSKENKKGFLSKLFDL